jgi:hypothetical protein
MFSILRVRNSVVPLTLPSFFLGDERGERIERSPYRLNL